MARWWNQLQSLVYSRFRWLPELAARRVVQREGVIDLPPLAPVRKAFRDLQVAVVTAGGVHLDDQPPFDMANPNGDASFRVIPGDVDVARLRITHDYYDHAAADRDVNCVLPLERLRELVARGEIGGLGPRHVGMMGHLLQDERRRLIRETAPAIAEMLAADRVDAVLATPG
jgi:D-proline reductase (dithiol) PrdB